MSIKRYYAQAKQTDAIFASRHSTSWQVFDRDWLSECGETMPIAMCISKATAFKLRDALNAEEALAYEGASNQ